MGKKLLHLSQDYGKIRVGFCIQRPMIGNIMLSPIPEKGLMHKKAALTIIFAKIMVKS
jgi:hypothetical protein